MYTLMDYKTKSDLIEQLIDFLPSAIIVLDTDTSIVLANTMAELFSNKSRLDIFGMRGGEAFGCIHANDDPEGCGHGKACKNCVVRNTVEKTLLTKENLMNIEAPMKFNDMGDRTLTVSTTWLQANQLVLVALNDITELKRQEMLRIENTQMQAAIKTGGAVCHELNQPLFVISGNIDLLRIDDTIPQEVQEHLAVIKEQIIRMSMITKKLMHITCFREKKYLSETIFDINTSSTMIN